MKKTIFNFWLDDDIKIELVKIGAARDWSIAQLINNILRNVLKRKLLTKVLDK